MYQISLVYGYKEGDCGVYHVFETFDPDEQIDFEVASNRIAEMLDATTDDANYNCDMMYINIPSATVEKIIKDYVEDRGAHK